MSNNGDPLDDNEMSIDDFSQRVFTDKQIQFMDGDEASLDQIGEIVLSLKSKPLKRLALGCKDGPGTVNTKLDTLAKVKEYYKDGNNRNDNDGECCLLTAFVLEMLCYEIGCCVKRTMQELVVYRMPLMLMVRSLGFDRAKHLKVVTLRNCNLTDYGCQSFFKNISPVINRIDLTCNGITAEGAGYIGKAIRRQIKLRDRNRYGIKRLLLNNNPIKSAGLKLLNEGIINDFCLKCLELRYCNIDDVGDSLILVSVNTELEVFDLRGNPVADIEDINKITREVLKNNPPQQSTYKWSTLESLLLN